jgi:4-amino-4-deoxy-L-arabinose transferase-like glycosyltransferase
VPEKSDFYLGGSFVPDIPAARTSDALKHVVEPAGRALESACRKGALLLALFFFLLYLPALPSLSHWRGDEQFYTDAALSMEKTGNYLTPTYPDGSLRFKKPILTYWLVLSGYKVFGFNYFASRLPFLISGALSVWLTFELGRVVTRRPREALGATAITASNLTAMHASIRSTPDMALCLFLLTSLLGFASLLFQARSNRFYALAYFGAALAVATKGFSGLLPVLYAFLYCAIARPSGLRARNLLHPVITPVALLMAGTWYAVSFFQHGTFVATDFFGDQIGERLSGEKFYVLSNAMAYLGSFLLQLPWSLLALMAFVAQRRSVLADLRQNKEPLLFAGGWILLFLVVFSFGNIQRTRYFLPAYPFLALFCSFFLLHESSEWKLGHLADLGLHLFYWLGMIAGLALAVFGLAVAPALVVSGFALAIAAFGPMRISRRWPAPQRLAAAAGYIIVVYSVNLLFITPTFHFSPVPEMTRRLLAVKPGPSPLPMAGVPVDYASQIRVLSAGKLEPYIVAGSECDKALAVHGLLICTKEVLNEWNPNGRSIERCATGSTPWKTQDYLNLCRTNTRQAFLKSKRMDYYLVTPSRRGEAARIVGENKQAYRIVWEGPGSGNDLSKHIVR